MSRVVLSLLALSVAAASNATAPQGGEDPSVIANPEEATVGDDLDQVWVFFSACLVFLMQAGFALVEAGSVSNKNVQNIFFKNFMDAVLGCIWFWLLGYGFAYGNAEDGPFIGAANFALSEAVNGDSAWISFFFQYVFAATAATIVSGAVAERCKIQAYFVYASVLTAFVYPVVVHWVWDIEGWLSAFNPNPLFGGNGMLDFAGSGVVHMVGGLCGLVAAVVIGPRRGRFDENGNVRPMQGHSLTLVTFGVFILGFGGYGFNSGATLGAQGGAVSLGAKVAVNTTIAAAAGAISSTVTTWIFDKKYSLVAALNGLLAGLVSVTAPCAVIDPWAAFVIGIIGGWVYLLASNLLLKLKIDDPVDAAPVHGFCGFWGVLATGLFVTEANLKNAYGEDRTLDLGLQFATQLVGGLSIFAWSVAMALPLFLCLKYTIGLRVSKLEEVFGLDRMEHGGTAYQEDSMETEILAKVVQILEGHTYGSDLTLDEQNALKDTFQLFDIDHSNTISCAEFLGTIKQLHVNIDPVMAEEMYHKSEQSNHEMDFDTFKQFILTKRQAVGKQKSKLSARGANLELPEPSAPVTGGEAEMQPLNANVWV